MKVFNKVADLQNELFARRKAGLSVGLVPTMGALHAGHASLVERCARECGTAVVSVFLNPTQFNDKGDLDRYPRTMEADLRLLEASGAHCVFAPSAEEIYPVGDTRSFSFPPVTEVMEGEHRPGHFNGVCQVVSRLFYIARPDKAYFGEKDFQQVAVVRRLVAHLGLPVEIVACPTVREADGLAMSSRNTLLTPGEREAAAGIYRALAESVEYSLGHTPQQTAQMVEEAINAVPGLRVEYVSIVDGGTLLPISSWDEAPHAVGCATVYCGDTPIRLIDHVTYRRP